MNPFDVGSDRVIDQLIEFEGQQRQIIRDHLSPLAAQNWNDAMQAGLDIEGDTVIALIDLLSHPDPAVATAAAWQFRWLAERELNDGVMQQLISLLSSPAENVRAAGALALGPIAARIESPQVAEMLLRLLNDSSSLVRKTGAGVVGRLGAQFARPEVFQRLASLVQFDENGEVGLAAERAIDNLTRVAVGMEIAADEELFLPDWLHGIITKIQGYRPGPDLARHARSILGVAAGWVQIDNPIPVLGAVRGGPASTVKAESDDGTLLAELYMDGSAVRLTIRSPKSAIARFAVLGSDDRVVTYEETELVPRGKFFVANRIWKDTEAESIRQAIQAGCLLLVGTNG